MNKPWIVSVEKFSLKLFCFSISDLEIKRSWFESDTKLFKKFSSLVVILLVGLADKQLSLVIPTACFKTLFRNRYLD